MTSAGMSSASNTRDSRGAMKAHFTAVASVYLAVRTTDDEPIEHIARRLEGAGPVRVADIACGTGRYDALLFEALPELRLTCVDANQAMIDEARQHLSEQGFDDVDAVVSNVADLQLEANAYDAILCFNAIHHIDFPTFLKRTIPALKPDGSLFIYTRLPGQNARSIWGRFFPGFAEKESRLYPLEDMYRWIQEAEGLWFRQATGFRYRRNASIDRLLDQVGSQHYSTFALYPPEELERSIATFQDQLGTVFDDLDDISWYDENILLEAVRVQE